MLRLSLILHLDMQICHRQEAHTVRPHHEILVDDVGSLIFPTIEYQFPDFREGSQRLLAIVVMRAATPEGFLRKLDVLILDASIHHAA